MLTPYVPLPPKIPRPARKLRPRPIIGSLRGAVAVPKRRVAYSSLEMSSQSTATSAAAPDVQAGVPATQVSLSRVGVTGVEKVIRVEANGRENLFYAELECFVDLEPRQ